MTDSVLERKSKMTDAVLSDHEFHDEDRTLTSETALLLWWYNTRCSGGFRLTTRGYRAFLKAGYITFDYTLKNNLSSKMLLSLDRKLQYPYYLYKDKLVLFSEKEAMMLQLYPDIETFLRLY